MMRARVHLFAGITLAAAMAAAAHAQAPAPPAGNATPAAPPASTAPAPPPNYVYSAEGRRDPFGSLVGRGAGEPSRPGQSGAARPEGIPGLLINDVAVRGIVQTRTGFIAMVAAPNGRTYTLRPGDRVFDGTVRAINAQFIVFMQEVSDPLSLEKQREVRRYLRGGGEGIK